MDGLTNYSDNRAIIFADEPEDRQQKYRLNRYADYLDEISAKWYMPDLKAYSAYLKEQGLSAGSRSAHLSTIRMRYVDIVLNRDPFWTIAKKEAPGDFVAQKAFVDEIIERLKNAINPRLSRVKTVKVQDRPNNQIRLTSKQAEALLKAPDSGTLQGLRDRAILALMLATGIREAELCALQVEDLRQRDANGELVLHIREGKGAKERIVYYGPLAGVLGVVDRYLEAAGITAGPVFRGLHQNKRDLRSTPLSVRQVEYILSSYPIRIGKEKKSVKPHDLRRSFARLWFEAGGDLTGLQQNLGHVDQRTTLSYIGSLGAEHRKPPELFKFS